MSPVSPIVLSEKQRKIISDLSLAISKEGIEVKIDEPFGTPNEGLVAVDVEHNESGEYVGCGFYFGTSVAYYYSSLFHLHSVDFQSLAIIAHNGVSDFECLNMWGINVSNEQLYWDSMLLGHILDSSLKSYSLKDMAKRELGIIYPSYDDIVGKRGIKAERTTLDKQPLELVSMYNAMDCIVTWQLYLKQKKHVN